MHPCEFEPHRGIARLTPMLAYDLGPSWRTLTWNVIRHDSGLKLVLYPSYRADRIRIRAKELNAEITVGFPIGERWRLVRRVLYELLPKAVDRMREPYYLRHTAPPERQGRESARRVGQALGTNWPVTDNTRLHSCRFSVPQAGPLEAPYMKFVGDRVMLHHTLIPVDELVCLIQWPPEQMREDVRRLLEIVDRGDGTVTLDQARELAEIRCRLEACDAG